MRCGCATSEAGCRPPAGTRHWTPGQACGGALYCTPTSSPPIPLCPLNLRGWNAPTYRPKTHPTPVGRRGSEPTPISSLAGSKTFWRCTGNYKECLPPQLLSMLHIGCLPIEKKRTNSGNEHFHALSPPKKSILRLTSNKKTRNFPKFGPLTQSIPYVPSDPTLTPQGTSISHSGDPAPNHPPTHSQ